VPGDNIHLLSMAPELRTLLLLEGFVFELRDGRHLLVVSQGPCHLRQIARKPFDIKGYRFFFVTER
jgi:hypothetical protein